MAVRCHGARHFYTWRVGVAMHRNGFRAVTHIVWRIVVRIVTGVRMMPTWLVDVIVVGVKESGGVETTLERTIGRHDPSESWKRTGIAEAQGGGSAVHTGSRGVVEPYASEIQRHIDFVAGVGVETVEPNFVELGVDLFGPHFVDENVGLDFVVIAAVDHKLGLSVEVTDSALGLTEGEIANGVSRNAQSQRDKSQRKKDFFHNNESFICKFVGN